MKNARILLALGVLLLALLMAPPRARAGSSDNIRTSFVRDDLETPRFQISTETSYLWGFIGNPHSYEVAAQFVTARMRWGAIHGDGFFHGYNQLYFLVMAEPFTRGWENHYFGISTGFRYNFVRRGSHLTPFVSGGVGLGGVDSTRRQESGSLGQNFTFNILTAVGVACQLDEHWSVTAAVQYEHLSNAGLSEPERPNSSLNLIGPQLGVTYSF